MGISKAIDYRLMAGLSVISMAHLLTRDSKDVMDLWTFLANKP